MIMADVFVGSLVDPAVKAHAVLNASNPHVALGSGVSGAIEEACGESFQARVRAAWKDEFDEPLDAQDCLVTSAGTRARSAGSCTSRRWTTRSVIQRPAVRLAVAACTKSALVEALELSRGVESHFVLALPLLGAGHVGLGPVASAAAMMGSIREFLEAHPSERMVLRFAVLEASQEMLIPRAAERHGVPFLDAESA
ncbi:MAG: O-acetyl-ADP-ribose deacetylase (regulator of RNase III) [Polyangiales bacterium]|jgi:O-acetyl-ADP-ribose deacetylase (regulator of RNase III)